MNEFMLVAGIHLLGVASPGPDLAIVLKNSLSHDKKQGVFTALGIAIGISIHLTYSIIGLAAIISRSIVLFNIIKTVGALYLIWIGYKSLRTKRSDQSIEI